MDTVQVSVQGFYDTFPVFNTETYPEAVVGAYLGKAQNYISNLNYGRLVDTAREYGIYLMTAHLLVLKDLLAQNGGGAIGYETSAKIDAISVSLAPPSGSDLLERWFELSGYGMELRALLMMKSCVPFYVGGSCVRYT